MERFMENDLTDLDPLEGDDVSRWYDPSKAYTPTPIDGPAAAASNADSAAPSADVGDAPGLLGVVQPAGVTTIGGQVVGNLTSAQSNLGGSPIDANPSAPINPYSDGVFHSDDAGGISLVGNPANRRLMKEWSEKWGQDWPRDPVSGRPYDVAHIRAKADGGQDHVDNIRPLHPDAHKAEHIENGDYSRWAKRSSIARAFGGRVARSIEPLSLLSGLLGLVSGRIRTDSFNDFMGDMTGIPSPDDQERALESQQRALNPNWKPGDPLGA
jgi:hypothetical protein